MSQPPAAPELADNPPPAWFGHGPSQFVPGCLSGWRQAAVLVRVRATTAAPVGSAAALHRLHAMLECWQRSAGAETTAAPAAPTDGAWTRWVLALAAAAVALLRGSALPLWDAPQILPAPVTTARDPRWTSLLLPVCPGRPQASVQAWQWTLQASGRCVATDDAAKAAALFADGCAQLRPWALQGGNSPRLLHAAMAQDVPVLALGGELFQYGQGRRAQWFHSTFTLRTANISARLARDKHAAATRLRQAGLPVPRHHAVNTPAAALQAAQQLGYPVVIKPLNQDGGRGVAAGLQTEAEVRAAYEAAQALSATVLVEQHVAGRDYRLTVLDGELLWAIERIPAGVTGDGKQTIAQLVATENARPQRGMGHHAVLKQLRLDAAAQEVLQGQGLHPEAVPAAGRFVRLSRIANVAMGGQPVAVTAQVHPDNAQLAVRAAAALRLDLAGVDLLIPDITCSWREGGAAICEVNAQPQLGATTGPHLYGEILRRRLGGNGRIPVLAVLGAPPADPWVPALVQALGGADSGVGWCMREGAGINQHWLNRAPHSLITSTQMLLTDATVDMLVLSLQDDEWLQRGLPVDRIDALVLAGSRLLPTAASASTPVGGASVAVSGKVLATLLPACVGPVLLLDDARLDPARVRQVLPQHGELQLVSRDVCLHRLLHWRAHAH